MSYLANLASPTTSTVVISDYANSQDTVLIDAIRQNIDRLCPACVPQNVMSAVGYVWGKDVSPLLAPLPENKLFDVVICADLIFNRSEHEKLLSTIQQCLVDQGGAAYIAFSHHDPNKADQDMRFFTLGEYIAQTCTWSIRILAYSSFCLQNTQRKKSLSISQ